MKKTQDGRNWQRIKRRLREAQSALGKALVEDPQRIQEIYRRRAIRLAEKKSDTFVSEKKIDILTFRLAQDLYGIELKEISKVMALKSFTRVPGSLPEFSGVLNLRGEIIPVLDLAQVLQLSQANSKTASQAVALLVRRNGCNLFLRVGQVEQVRRLSRPELKQPSESSTSLPMRFLEALTSDGMIILNMEAIFSKYILAA